MKVLALYYSSRNHGNNVGQIGNQYYIFEIKKIKKN